MGIKRDQNATFLKIKSSHENEVKAASKEKRKRNGKNKGGFNKEAPVPKILQKFLGLDKKKLYPRSELYHLLNEKLLDDETKLREKKEKLLKDYEASLKEINSQ